MIQVVRRSIMVVPSEEARVVALRGKGVRGPTLSQPPWPRIHGVDGFTTGRSLLPTHAKASRATQGNGRKAYTVGMPPSPSSDSMQ